MNRIAMASAVLAAGMLVLSGCPGSRSSSSGGGGGGPAAPTVTAITPSTGDTSGGLAVTVDGTGFQPGAALTLGGVAATGVALVSDTRITGVSPAVAAPGPVDVVVTNTDTLSGTLPDGFTYYPPSGGTFSEVTVLGGLNFPVALAFAPDWATTDRLFFTEKNTGNVRIIQGGALLTQPFVSVSVAGGGERGLLGITFDPNYGANGYVYIFYDVPGTPITQRLERYTDSGNVGIDPLILRDNLPSDAFNHNGGNIAFGPDGMLYLTLGDDAVPAASDSDTVFPGKIHRMNPDGSAPTDNPWYDGANPTAPISYFWCKGLRNSFDFGFHPLTGDLYASENGPNVNDEVNLIRAGSHYGWDASRVSGPRGLPAFVDPVDWFSPPPSLTGVGFNVGHRYPESYVGDTFIGAWNSGVIYRVDMTGPAYAYDRANRSTLLTIPGQVTDVLGGPDGYLYVSTSGAIYRIEYN